MFGSLGLVRDSPDDVAADLAWQAEVRGVMEEDRKADEVRGMPSVLQDFEDVAVEGGLWSEDSESLPELLPVGWSSDDQEGHFGDEDDKSMLQGFDAEVKAYGTGVVLLSETDGPVVHATIRDTQE